MAYNSYWQKIFLCPRQSYLLLSFKVTCTNNRLSWIKLTNFFESKLTFTSLIMSIIWFVMFYVNLLICRTFMYSLRNSCYSVAIASYVFLNENIQIFSLFCFKTLIRMIGLSNAKSGFDLNCFIYSENSTWCYGYINRNQHKLTIYINVTQIAFDSNCSRFRFFS